MKSLIVTLLVCLVTTAIPAAEQPIFQMRLVEDAPSADSEQMPLILKHQNSAHTNLLQVQKSILLDQTALKSAKPATDALGHPIIDIAFTEKGKNEFADFTRHNIDKRLAIVIAGKVYAAPVIRTEINGGQAQISGSFTKEEAKTLANQISGAIPKR